MVLKQDKYFAEAIFFFEGNQVVKEMLFVEFQAVLESVVGIPEYAKQEYQAAYITVGPYLTLQSVVLFNIRFDKDGHVVKEWNIPLGALTRNAVAGPDLGQGNILLVTRDSCEDEYKDSLWNPGKHEIELLTSVRDSVRRNKIGAYDGGDRRRYGSEGSPFGVPDFELIGDESGLGSNYQQDLVNNIETTLKYKYESKIKQLHKQRDETVRQLEAQIKTLKKQNVETKKQVTKLENDNKDHVDVIAKKYKTKLNKQLAKVKDDLKADLDAKELELQYCQESERQLQEEIQQLEESIEGNKRHAVNSFLSATLDSGVELIVTQTGVGSFSLKQDQIHAYLDSPLEFWAQQCGVVVAQYVAWREHHENPVCQAGATTGCDCGAQLKSIYNPQEFVIGYSDMCPEHQLQQSKDAAQAY